MSGDEATAAPQPEERVRIAGLGGRGDGLAEDGTPVAFALPGEQVRIRRRDGRGDLVAVEVPAPERVAPFCPHFTRCGGCRTQHLAAEPYAAWKRGLLETALRQAGLEAPVAPTIAAGGRGRRRLTLHVRAVDGQAQAGLMAARSHDLVPIDHCPITTSALHRAPAVARALAAPLGHGRKPLDVVVLDADDGLDVDVRGHGTIGAGVRAALVDLAARLDLARLSLHGERVAERRPVTLASGRARLQPPPGGFLQATAAGEAALAGLVVAAMAPRTRRVADLFAGCGPFSLALAGLAEVHAVEGDPAALQGLDRAARVGAGLRRVGTERRDLFRRPLLPTELDAFDAVVLDPPRAGAQAQMRQLAAARVPLVVSVSCDPGTFARDAAVLVGGGYRLEGVTPVDQFVHTGHLEMVGTFRRPAPGRSRRAVR